MRYILALALLLAATAQAAACPGAEPCHVAGGSYHAVPPPGWNGTTPLPVLLYYHGYRQSGAEVIGNPDVAGPAATAGVLLVAPNGIGGSWAHVGSPSSARDEMAFLDTMLADLERRFPIDTARLWVSGFSQGGSMAWDVACYRGDRFAAFFPAAGAFWRPQPERCPAGPVDIMHAHGRDDPVVPMTGRPIRQVFHQGDVARGIELWRRADGCPAEPDRTAMVGPAHCRIWSACESGRAVGLCLHDDGHMVPDGWLAWALARAAALPAR